MAEIAGLAFVATLLTILATGVVISLMVAHIMTHWEEFEDLVKFATMFIVLFVSYFIAIGTYKYMHQTPQETEYVLEAE